MAYVRGKREGAVEKTRSRDHAVQEIVPSAAWTEDSDCHFLLVDLPDFKKEEVKLQVDKSGQITIGGERLVNSDKYIYFEKTFKAPANSDIDMVTGKFDGEILYVTLPKKPKVEKTEPKNEIKNDKGVTKNDIEQTEEETSSEHERSKESNDQEQSKNMKEESNKGPSVDGFDKEDIKKWEREYSLLERATKMICKNKQILLTAALVFSLGMLVSRKIDSVHQQE